MIFSNVLVVPGNSLPADRLAARSWINKGHPTISVALAHIFDKGHFAAEPNDTTYSVEGFNTGIPSSNHKKIEPIPFQQGRIAAENRGCLHCNLGLWVWSVLHWKWFMKRRITGFCLWIDPIKIPNHGYAIPSVSFTESGGKLDLVIMNPDALVTPYRLFLYRQPMQTPATSREKPAVIPTLHQNGTRRHAPTAPLITF